MNLYKNLLEKKKLELTKEKDEIKFKRKKKASLYYYKNRDIILLKNSNKKEEIKIYNKEWYEKNKFKLLEKRKLKKKKNKLIFLMIKIHILFYMMAF